MKRNVTIVAGSILLLAGGLVAVAGLHGHGAHGGHAEMKGAGGPMMIPHMVSWLVDQTLSEVGATEAQRTQVIAVKDRVLSQAMALHGAHDTTHAEFKAQWDAERMDAPRLHALVDARVDELRRVLHTSVDGIVEIHDTLTPQQRRTLTERIEAMHGGGHGDK